MTGVDCLKIKINQEIYFFSEIYFLKLSEKSEIKLLAALMSGEGFPFGLQMVTFSLCAHLAFPQCVCLGQGWGQGRREGEREGRERGRKGGRERGENMLSCISSSKDVDPIG